MHLASKILTLTTIILPSSYDSIKMFKMWYFRFIDHKTFLYIITQYDTVWDSRCSKRHLDYRKRILYQTESCTIGIEKDIHSDKHIHTGINTSIWQRHTDKHTDLQRQTLIRLTFQPDTRFLSEMDHMDHVHQLCLAFIIIFWKNIKKRGCVHAFSY